MQTQPSVWLQLILSRMWSIIKPELTSSHYIYYYWDSNDLAIKFLSWLEAHCFEFSYCHKIQTTSNRYSCAALSKPWGRTNGNFKVYTSFRKMLLENALQLNFEAL